MSRALPSQPACWSWPLPPLPVRNDLYEVRTWQAGRCAICSVELGHGLFEDHDHATGDTRGYLCERCNFDEGREHGPAVYALYRERYPTLILGVLHRYRSTLHPTVKAASAALSEALGLARLLSDPEARAQRERDDAEFASYRIQRDPLPTEWTPLARAVHRVGLTGLELATAAERREQARLTPTVCLPSDGNPPTTRCSGHPWRPPVARQACRPCPDCWALDAELMHAMVGDGYGPTREAEVAHLADMWRAPSVLGGMVAR